MYYIWSGFKFSQTFIWTVVSKGWTGEVSVSKMTSNRTLFLHDNYCWNVGSQLICKSMAVSKLKDVDSARILDMNTEHTFIICVISTLGWPNIIVKSCTQSFFTCIQHIHMHIVTTGKCKRLGCTSYTFKTSILTVVTKDWTWEVSVSKLMSNYTLLL